MRKSLRLGSIGVALALVLTGCGGGVQEPEEELYQPAAYGNDRTEQCYFVEDPDETRVLKEDGLCEQDWNPAPWPEDEFAGFYPFFFYSGSGSHHYRDRYVPKAKHGAYATRISTLDKNPAFKQKVATLSPKAQYKSSSGKIVTGGAVKPGNFGSRVAGGGGGRIKPCALGPMNVDGIEIVLSKGGGGGSRGGGGGGARSGGSGSSGNKGSAPKGNSSGGGGSSNNNKAPAQPRC